MTTASEAQRRPRTRYTDQVKHATAADAEVRLSAYERLKPKQQAFVRHYIETQDPMEAALRAGYAQTYAQQVVYDWLPPRMDGRGNNRRQRPLTLIQEAIVEKRREVGERVEASAEKVLAELAQIGFASMTDFATWDNDDVFLIASDQLPPGMAACVQEVEVKENREGRRVKIKLYNKMDALDKLARFFGLYNERSSETSAEQLAADIQLFLRETKELDGV